MHEDDESIFAALRRSLRLSPGLGPFQIVRDPGGRERRDLRAGGRPSADDLLRECATGRSRRGLPGLTERT
jgi:hypothetical protein